MFELGLFTTPDREIWRHAEKIGTVIISKDSDFATMRMQATGGPAVVWLGLGNVTNGELEKAILSCLAEVISAIDEGELLVEVR